MSATDSTADESVDYAALYDDHSFGTHTPTNALRAANVKQCSACSCHFPAAYGRGESKFTVCSRRCHYRRKAQKLIAGVTYDHQYCAACFRRLKIVYPPGRRADSSQVIGDEDTYRAFNEDIPDCAIGEAEYEPHTSRGGQKVATSITPDGGFEELPLLQHSWACSCGHCDHKDVHRLEDDLSKRELVTLGDRLLEALRERRERSKHDEEWHKQAFFDRLKWFKAEPDWQRMDGELLERSLASALCLVDSGHRLEKPDHP